MNFNNSSDKQILHELTRRVRQRRLNVNMTQEELADKAGVHVQTIKNFESGSNSKIITFIQILRQLQDLDALDKFFPEAGISPVELLKLKGKERERASGSETTDNEKSEW